MGQMLETADSVASGEVGHTLRGQAYDIVSMKNEKEMIVCVGLVVMVVDTAEDAAAAETMDGAGIAVEIMEEIPIGEVSTMVMQSAIGMAMMPEETASLAAAAVIMAAVAVLPLSACRP